MNKDIVSEIYKYLNRDVYRVLYNNLYKSNIDIVRHIYYFYSHENAKKWVKELIVKDMVKHHMKQLGTNLDLFNVEEAFKIYHVLTRYKVHGDKEKKYFYIETCEKILNKTEDELVQMWIGTDVDRMIYEGKIHYRNKVIRLDKITINS